MSTSPASDGPVTSHPWTRIAATMLEGSEQVALSLDSLADRHAVVRRPQSRIVMTRTRAALRDTEALLKEAAKNLSRAAGTTTRRFA